MGIGINVKGSKRIEACHACLAEGNARVSNATNVPCEKHSQHYWRFKNKGEDNVFATEVQGKPCDLCTKSIGDPIHGLGKV